MLDLLTSPSLCQGASSVGEAPDGAADVAGVRRLLHHLGPHPQRRAQVCLSRRAQPRHHLRRRRQRQPESDGGDCGVTALLAW